MLGCLLGPADLACFLPLAFYPACGVCVSSVLSCVRSPCLPPPFLLCPAGVYKNEEIPRVPVVCTGNDFSTLYAPLIRDGRMEKYYWK